MVNIGMTVIVFENLRIMDRYSSSSSRTLSSSAGELCSQPCDDVASASLLGLATGCCVNEVVALGVNSIEKFLA